MAINPCSNRPKQRLRLRTRLHKARKNKEFIEPQRWPFRERLLSAAKAGLSGRTSRAAAGLPRHFQRLASALPTTTKPSARIIRANVAAPTPSDMAICGLG